MDVTRSRRLSMPNQFLIIAVGLAVFYWVLETIMDSVLFRKGRLFEQMFYPETHEVWMRSLVVALLLAFGYYGQRVVRKRLQAERELSESRERYALAQRAANIGSWDWNVLTGDVYWSEQIEPMFGFKPGEFGATYEAFLECVHPDDRRHVTDSVDAALQGAKRCDIVHRIVWPDGTVRWISAKGDVIRDQGGQPVRMLGVVQDITERKQAEQALHNSEERFRSIVETTYDWIWEIDRNLRHTYTNRGIESILGYGPKEFLALDPFDLMHEQDRAMVRENVSRCVAEKRGWTGWVIRWRHKDGDYRSLESNAVPILDSDGEVVGFRGSDRDITERERMEEELRRNERFLASVFESIQDGISVLDTDLTIRAVNSVMNRWYAQNLPLEGKTCHACYHDCPEPCDPCPTLRCIRSGQTECEIVPGLPGSPVQWVELFSYPIKDTDSGEVIGVVEFVRDITERKKDEEKREHLEVQLRQAQKMEAMGALAAGVAHDLNNGLTAIIGYTYTARSACEGHAEVIAALDEISKATDQAGAITRSLLTFSRKARTEKLSEHLGQVVDKSIRLLRRILPAAIEIVADVPVEAPGLWISADATQLQQVIINLAVNARDAMPEGGKLHVSVRHRPVDSSDVLSAVATKGMGAAVAIVEDNGCGMSKEVLDRIFEPFFTTKARGKGTGLGMAVVHGIVSAHQGHIEVTSEPGRGTRVALTFPCIGPPGAKDVVVKEEPLVRGHGQTLILAEDDEQLRSLTQSSLESAGYKVILAQDGLEALAEFEAHAPQVDLAVLDLDLPKKHGLSCLREMRKTRPDMPVLLITGNIDPSLDERIEGHTWVLRKPFRMTELAKVTAELLAASGQKKTGAS